MRTVSAEEARKIVMGRMTEIDVDVTPIIERVREQGDIAVRYYASRFDGFSGREYRVSQQRIDDAYTKVSSEFIEAISYASKNIEEFARAQRSTLKDLRIEREFGVIGHRVIPLESVACYIPGGRYPLPSTALMTLVPAVVAGVERRVALSPRFTPESIVAADMAGATEILEIGGVHGIAAVAYGTESIKPVSKVVGPGSRYVTAAKKYVFGQVGIDFIAGPSEVAVVIDEKADPSVVASDLLAQAEHDVDAGVFILSVDEGVIDRVKKELNAQLEELPTRDIAAESVLRGVAVLCRDIEELQSLCNYMAPEHLELQTSKNEEYAKGLVNYGSLFVGRNSAEVFGDYCSGPNHTLPTSRAARYTGGLSVLDFVKIQTFQELTDVSPLVGPVLELARSEGLEGHARAAEQRLNL